MDKRIGDQYQQQTRYDRQKMTGGGLDWASRPAPFKKISDFESIVKLPDPGTQGGAPLYTILQSRRSRRNFSGEPIDLQTLAQVLWVTNGATAQMQDLLLRTAPSAGGLYPVETYVLVNRVQELAPGVYHLHLPEWSLYGLRIGDFGAALASAALGQSLVAQSAVTFCFTAMIERSKWKYKERGYRYMYLDAGHIGQNLSLGAESLGLGCCMIGAFFDEEINRLLFVDGTSETILYLGCVGNVE